ncbi:MAG: hypothetical protein AAF358_09360 [Pseudomonadota bacterium]
MTPLATSEYHAAVFYPKTDNNPDTKMAAQEKQDLEKSEAFARKVKEFFPDLEDEVETMRRDFDLSDEDKEREFCFHNPR